MEKEKDNQLVPAPEDQLVAVEAEEKEKQPEMVGCTLANFHEAGRSEYLAHYIFSSFGTSVPVPRQEDIRYDLVSLSGPCN